ncbi:MAG: efflux transporter outer membrane subunit [Planctomycetota bacterium]|jgi:multidrug efflux system outer membrane protein
MQNNIILKINIIMIVSAAALIPGCMVGPKYSRPETAAETPSGYYEAGQNIQDVNMLASTNTWWLRFGDKTTSQLVQNALENNYDLKAATARVFQAQAVLVQTKGAQLPQVSASFDRTMTRSDLSDLVPGSGVTKDRTYATQFNISYVLDLFGKLKHTERAAWQDLLTTQASKQTVVHSLVAAVINTRITIATLQNELDVAMANTASRQKTLEIVERRYRKGLASPVEVRLARENLAASKSTEPAFELLIIQAQFALDVLLGQRPGSSQELERTLPDLPDLEPVPVGIPAALLDRRPDLRVAEHALKAANERIGVSIAQLYPDLNFIAGVGWRSGTSDSMYPDSAYVYSTVFSAVQPIFTGGQLQAQVDATEAIFQELAAGYAGAVLVAMKEVEDALVAEQKLQEQLKEVQIRFEEAKAAEDLSRDRYQQGVSPLLLVLESERRRRIAETELALLKGRLWANRVSLFLALGGDWQMETLLADNKENNYEANR